MYSLILKPRALEMLNEAYWWYEEQLPGLGERLIEETEKAFNRLTVAPLAYSLLHDYYRQLMLPHFPYKIVFEVVGKEIIIYAVFHTGRNPEKMFR